MNFSFPQTVENSVESLCRGVKKSEGAEKQNSIFKKAALLKGVIPHGMGKCHEVTKGIAR